ncbi:glycosyltransferase family 4 protein [Geomonas oryzae]|uniref:glycosyltransferase family 4 protein n=1 Tax=Geomonas oryzae TaxID=2364273 RepID=UPI00100B7E8B|nr:glycosyltransferase family 4 protein [Geomonas oryzae]
MKVLWLSNKVLSPLDSGTTGTWLEAMAQSLSASDGLQLGNISLGGVCEPSRQDLGTVSQWVMPAVLRPGGDGLPPRETVAAIVKAVDEFAPDLVHVWGTESFWGLLTSRGMIRRPALLEMQGLSLSISSVYGGGLTLLEQLRCVGLKEIVRGNSILQGRKRFERWSTLEREMIQGHDFISTQSSWMRAQVLAMNSGSTVFTTDRVLRPPFITGEQWEYHGDPVIFCSAAYSSPFKGLHVAVRSLGLLKRRFPNVRLHIAGLHQRAGLRRDGYIAWVQGEVRRLGLEENVRWLGALSAGEIVGEMRRASAILLPTYVESYCLALAEAMMLGVPAVVTYTGGTSCLARDGESALFFAPGDTAMCAYQLERILSDRELACSISNMARTVALARNDTQRIIANQIEIYKRLCDR